MADAKEQSDKLAASEGGVAADVNKKSASKSDVLKAWGQFVGNGDKLDLETFTGEDGVEVTRLFNANGNGTVAEARGDDALLRLYKSAGLAKVDDGTVPSSDDAAEPHPMPASGVEANANQVVVKDTDPENPGTAVAEARKAAGQPISE